MTGHKPNLYTMTEILTNHTTKTNNNGHKFIFKFIRYLQADSVVKNADEKYVLRQKPGRDS